MSMLPNRLADQPTSFEASPLDLNQPRAYKSWREEKLRDYPESLSQLVVHVANPAKLSEAEKHALYKGIAKTNAVIFQCASPDQVDKKSISQLGEQLGLQHLDKHLCADEDRIASITVDQSGSKNIYIPYTDRPISWHSDGYYNELANHSVRSFVLYCAHPAEQGGTNRWLDHELAYIYLRDLSPAYIKALSHPQAMTIPANTMNGKTIRGAQTGPVFSVDTQGQLNMRFTARTRSIEWRKDPMTQAAVAQLNTLLASQHKGIFEHRLQAGQGLITNNVLHTRSGFQDSEASQRLLYRARYYQRIDHPQEVSTC